jgi:predicted O-methyltransferase YrrM
MMMKRSIIVSSLLVTTLHAWITVDELQQKLHISSHLLDQFNRNLQAIENEAEASWREYYHVLPGLINTYGLKKGVEIGVSTGGHSDALLKQTNIETLYSIDPWETNPSLHMGHPAMFDVLHLRVVSRLKRYGNRSVVFRNYSYQVVDQFADGSLDFVFVDGDHNYGAVKKDLEDWYRKIRSGGIMAGDDYATVWPGVPQAVNEFFAKLNIPVHQDAGQPRIWWIIKP